MDDLAVLDTGFFDEEPDPQNVSNLDTNVDDEPNHDNDEGGQKPTEEPEDDLITEYLRLKGIDANAVKMENENGETEALNFRDLSREEQLQLLNYNPAAQETPALEEDEEQFLQTLRQNKMSVKDYLNAYRNHVIDQYVAESETQMPQSWTVDDYTDEELFIADLKDKIPDLTEEDAQQALEIERQNPELFQKKMAGLRTDYQNREKALLAQQEEQQRQMQEQQAAQMEKVIVETIQQNNSIDLGDMSLELSTDDMNDIASFILDSDAAGVRHLVKALNDPRTLVQMSWWLLKGQDAFNQVTQYYKKQIAEARKSARTSASLATKPKTVITKPKQNGSNTPAKTVDELYENLI